MASFYVPPEVGEQVIDEIARKQIAEVWLNPGAESDALIARARALSHQADRRLQHRRDRQEPVLPVVNLLSVEVTLMPTHHKRHGAGAHDQRAQQPDPAELPPPPNRRPTEAPRPPQAHGRRA